MKKWFSTTLSDDPRLAQDALRRYIEGEAAPNECRAIQQRLQESDAWRNEYARLKDYLFTLKNLPTYSSPERVWKAIEDSVKNTNPQPVWFPWFYAHPAWATGMRTYTYVLFAATFALLLLTGNPQQVEPTFEIVAVDDINGFGKEAETYIAYHDFKNESAESLIAFNTVNWPQ